jgi:phosphoribosylformimino-5-aminoimidazole carboxamide ribotide isomerase
MRIIPVLDLQGGVVVRGVAGRRQEYRPVVSRLTKSCQPADVAKAFREHFGLTELYLADLDAIAGAAPALAVYSSLRELGCRLWVDAGVRDAAMVKPLTGAGIEVVVVGLETVSGPAALAEIRLRLSARLAFSLDLKGGVPLGELSAWEAPDAWSIAAQAVATGVGRVIVLDLARVGVGTGLGTEALCARLAETYPDLEIVAGGGVRGGEDLRRLRECGVSAVLVASALHDGRLRREDLAGL